MVIIFTARFLLWSRKGKTKPGRLCWVVLAEKEEEMGAKDGDGRIESIGPGMLEPKIRVDGFYFPGIAQPWIAMITLIDESGKVVAGSATSVAGSTIQEAKHLLEEALELFRSQHPLVLRSEEAEREWKKTRFVLLYPDERKEGV